MSTPLILKPSMFNKIIFENDYIILYNSLLGFKKILKLSLNNVQIVEILKSDKIFINELNNNMKQPIIELYKKGFIVDYSLNEKNIRNMMLQRKKNSNNLTLIVHTTKDCNFRCKYCSLDFESLHLNKEV